MQLCRKLSSHAPHSCERNHQAMLHAAVGKTIKPCFMQLWAKPSSHAPHSCEGNHQAMLHAAVSETIKPCFMQLWAKPSSHAPCSCEGNYQSHAPCSCEGNHQAMLHAAVSETIKPCSMQLWAKPSSHAPCSCEQNHQAMLHDIVAIQFDCKLNMMCGEDLTVILRWIKQYWSTTYMIVAATDTSRFNMLGLQYKDNVHVFVISINMTITATTTLYELYMYGAIRLLRGMVRKWLKWSILLKTKCFHGNIRKNE